MSQVPVVRIVHEPSAIYGGFLEINESDFDPKIHTLFDPEAKAKADAEAEAEAKAAKTAKAEAKAKADAEAKAAKQG